MGKLICAALICLLAAVAARGEDRQRRVIVFDGAVTEVGAAAIKSDDLWVTLKDLTRATKFILKPQGMCRDELCFPIPKARKSAFIAKKGSVTWFNLSEFARLVRQPVAHDQKHAVWFFGPRPDARNGYLASLEAPDFTLPDINGRMHSLSDFRGKKVLLITWASW
jgi:AhpC/TSA family